MTANPIHWTLPFWKPAKPGEQEIGPRRGAKVDLAGILNAQRWFSRPWVTALTFMAVA